MSDKEKLIEQMSIDINGAYNLIEVLPSDERQEKESLDVILWHLQNALNAGNKILKEKPTYEREN